MKRILFFSLLIFLVLSPLVNAIILTDKELYKPLDTVNVSLFHTEPLNNVKIIITNSEGKIVTSRFNLMENISSTHWVYSHTLVPQSPNGTYFINITAHQGTVLVNASIPLLEFNKTFDVEVWKANAYLNKQNFVLNDGVNFTVLITEKHSDDLTFDVFCSIKDPLKNEFINYSLFLTEVNEGFYRYFKIPDNYTLGTSTITINLTDLHKRKATLNLSFSVSEDFVIIPDSIEETLANEVIEKTFTLDNFRDDFVSVESVEISDKLKNIITIVQRPYLMQPLERSSMKIKIDARKATRGIYNGVISVYVDGSETPIFVNLEVLFSGLTAEDYSYIIWCFALNLILIIVLITLLRYRKIRKKKREEKKKKEEEKKREKELKEIYKKSPEYRTEYY